MSPVTGSTGLVTSPLYLSFVSPAWSFFRRKTESFDRGFVWFLEGHRPPWECQLLKSGKTRPRGLFELERMRTADLAKMLLLSVVRTHIATNIRVFCVCRRSVPFGKALLGDESAKIQRAARN